MFNDRQARIDEDLGEVEREGLVHKEAGQTLVPGPRMDTRVSVRITTPWDRERLRRMFSRASSETIFRRFHLPYPNVPERTLDLMLDAAQHDRESLVAIAEEEIIGHAMYVRHGYGGVAEVAIIVEDRWQSRGVGKLLLSELAERAKLRGIETFTAAVLATNRRMLGLATIFAGTNCTMQGGLYHVRMPLRTLEPAEYAPRTLPRTAKG